MSKIKSLVNFGKYFIAMKGMVAINLVFIHGLIGAVETINTNTTNLVTTRQTMFVNLAPLLHVEVKGRFGFLFAQLAKPK